MFDNADWSRRLTVALGHGVAVTAVTELRDWSESRVLRLTLRADSSDESVWYAKQVPARARTELSIYGSPARAALPAPEGCVLTADDGPWLVTRQAQGQQLADAPAGCWTEAAAGLADFHERCLSAEQALWPPGLARLADALTDLPERALAATRACIISGVYTGLTVAAVDKTEAYLLSQWPAFATEVAGYPQTLTHGDCHSGNIFVDSSGRIELIDWGAAACGPGLLDLVGLVDVAARMNETACDRAAVTAAYWGALSESTRRAYGERRRALILLSLVRALTELIWMAETDDDYGDRALRELDIVRAGLLRLAVVGAARESLRQLSEEPSS